MRRGRWFASVAVVVLGAAGLAVATPAPVPEADPIGDVIANSPPTQSDPGVIAPASPLSPTEGLLTETPAIEVTEERAEEEGTTEMPLGTPLPELADPLPRSRQGFAIVQRPQVCADEFGVESQRSLVGCPRGLVIAESFA